MPIEPTTTMRKRSFIVVLLGVMVEYYEYSLFGFSAAIIANEFFPHYDPITALLNTFGLFAIGYFAKLFGALLFGYIGDHYGRSMALKISMVGIAIPTTIISILPNYHSWGMVSVILLLVCRLLQGIFIAGEHDGVSIYILEQVSKKRACFANSIVGLCYNGGIYIATFAFAIANLESMPDWAWRLPFLLGGILGFVTLMLRQYIPESQAFEQQTAQQPIRLRDILNHHKSSFFLSLFMFGSVGSMYHFYVIFWHTYLHKVLAYISLEKASLYTSLLVLFHMLCKPVVGLLGDIIGPRRMMKFGCIFMLATNTYNYYMLQTQDVHLVSLWMIALSLAFFNVAGYVNLVALFPVRERYRALTLAHALASCIFSGTVPILCTWLWHQSNIDHIPLAYLSIFPIIIFIIFQKSDHKHRP